MTKKEKSIDEMIKNNKYIGRSFDEVLKKDLEDEEFRILYEQEMFLNSISNTITDLREEKGLTQSDVAEKSGMKQSAIARLESARNTRLPSLELLNKIARSLGKKLIISFADSDKNKDSDKNNHKTHKHA
jgi:ribosome-binding protein aMBF1 (putative translation factor)